ncbi:Translation initiation factor eIF-2B subunit epsilon [Thelohanellus kitauei]|uniref:Translation initiation factor eIF-2B subunit epsilon n=1 Tax=Thelohanellus kitauei TaxID=669202 RepID=A0A0C2MPF4_THEKT|nr:Translation initiation factor eIF-2B subunit epsilon [Thelohanellus kitauei]
MKRAMSRNPFKWCLFSTYKPINIGIPAVMMPVVDKPAIDYTLWSLVSAGLKKIMIVLSRHVETVKRYVMQSAVSREVDVVIEFLPVCPNSCFTVGDVLRNLHERDPGLHTRGEFIVIDGLLMAKIDLKRLVDRHLVRRLNDDRVVLTVLYHHIRPDSQMQDDHKPKWLMLVDTDKNEILQIEADNIEQFQLTKRRIKGRYKMDFLSNHVHTGIYLLDDRAITLFCDNFDFATVDDFLKNILGDEVLQRAVCYEVVDDYVEIMDSLGHYYDMCFNVLQKWSFPDAPDFRHFTVHQRTLYLGTSVEISRSCSVNGWTSIGHNSIIGSNGSITRSIIGSNCIIGDRTIINNSILWDGINIEADCIVENSIICDGVVILSKTNVSSGCIIGSNITVGPNVTIPHKTFVYHCTNESDIVGALDIVDLGSQSNGVVYEIDKVYHEMYDWGRSTQRLKHKSDGQNSTVSPKPEEESDDDCDFQGSVRESVSYGFERRVHVDTIITEITALKSTFSMNYRALQDAARDSIVDFCFPKKMIDQEQIMSHIKNFSESLGSFCKKFFRSSDQLTMLVQSFEDSIYNRTHLHSLYSRLIIILFYCSIIDYDFLKMWRDYREDNCDNERIHFRTEKIQQCLSYLDRKENEASSETETDSDVDE